MSQSGSPGAVGKLVPGAVLMARPEGSVVEGCVPTPGTKFPHLGTSLLLEIQAAKVPSTAEGRELGRYCWRLGN